MIHVRRDQNGYDDDHYLSVRAVGDALEGSERIKLSLGEAIVCGRSRHCDWSAKRTPLFLGNGDDDAKERRDRLRQSVAWRSMSRRHVRISYLAPDLVDVENLSGNGTWLDGKRVDRVVLTDCRRRSHTIKMGPLGITLELQPGSLPVDVPTAAAQ